MELKQKFIELVKNDDFIKNISNVLSLRELGNKLHGDSLEFSMVEWVNFYNLQIYAKHTGKDFFRSGKNSDMILSKSRETLDRYMFLIRKIKDIEKSKLNYLKELFKEFNYIYSFKSMKQAKPFLIDKLNLEIETLEKDIFFLSLKNYGEGPLQLLTDPESSLINLCKSKLINENEECDIDKNIINSDIFRNFEDDIILSCIYNEKNYKFSIIWINIRDLFNKVEKVKFIPKKEYTEYNKKIKYEKFIFEDKFGNYLFEVRYGKKDSNALQRGLWTKTSIENGFEVLLKHIDYTIDEIYLDKVRKTISGLPTASEIEDKKMIKILKEKLNKYEKTLS